MKGKTVLVLLVIALLALSGCPITVPGTPTQAEDIEARVAKCRNAMAEFAAEEAEKPDANAAELQANAELACDILIREDESMCNDTTNFPDEKARTFCLAIVHKDVKECDVLTDQEEKAECANTTVTTLGVWMTIPGGGSGVAGDLFWAFAKAAKD